MKVLEHDDDGTFRGQPNQESGQCVAQSESLELGIEWWWRLEVRHEITDLGDEQADLCRSPSEGGCHHVCREVLDERSGGLHPRPEGRSAAPAVALTPHHERPA